MPQLRNDDEHIEISSQRARQGRMGKHTLIILVVSLGLAIIAGFLLGIIPPAAFRP